MALSGGRVSMTADTSPVATIIHDSTYMGIFRFFILKVIFILMCLSSLSVPA
jgi:hypothetical protein